MRIHLSIALFILLLSGSIGCSDKRTAEEKICREAVDRHIWCVGEVFDKEMAAVAHSTREERIKTCVKDERIRERYQACLPEKGCDAFTDCLIDDAGKTGSRPAAGTTRKEQESREIPDD